MPPFSKTAILNLQLACRGWPGTMGHRRNDRAHPAFQKMDTPEQPHEEDELLVSKQGGSGNRRTRKRRTAVPKETMYAIELHRRTLRIRLMVALAVLVLAAVIAAVAAWYPGTEGFRKRLDRMALRSLGTEVAMENVVLGPFQANADQLEATWPGGNFLESFSADGITASVLPQRYFTRNYGGDELNAASAKLSLRYPDAESPAIVPEALEGKSGVSFNRIGTPKFEVQFGEAGAQTSARIFDTEAAFYPEGPGGVPRAMLYSGNLELPSWPRLLIERAIIDFPEGIARITSMRIRDSLPGITSDILAGGGDIGGDVFLDPAEASTLQIALEGFQLQALIGEGAGRIFVGRVDFTAAEMAELRQDASHIFVGRVNTRRGEESGVIRISQEDGLQMRAELVANPLSQLTFSHFPFLDFLARQIDDRWFLNPIFDEAPSLVLIRNGNEMVFDEINFTSRHRMAIRGSFSIDQDDEISGEIEVGLTPTVIDAAIVRRLDGMFSAERDGFRWIKLELGGTTQAPTDNFNALFIEAPMPEIELPMTLPPAPTPEEPDAEPEQEPQQPRREARPAVLPLLDLDDE